MEIRIVPMSFDDIEFTNKTIKQVQDEFFMDSLINIEKGWYYYAKSGLDAQEGTLLLFQMDNTIIASAILDQVLTFRKTTDEGNKGTFVLKKDSIKVFKPITKEEFASITNGLIKSFSQVKRKISSSDINIDELEKRMEINN